MRELVYPVMGVYYNGNTGLTLDAKPHVAWCRCGRLKTRSAQTHVWSEMQGFPETSLKWSAKLLKLALDLELRSYSDSCWSGRGVTQTRIEREFTHARV